ncbi:MAG: hypothetical protein OXI46_11390 [Gemmatimonadota bacterium]|nr:hypothetical protein [Gemmatimonadota bacterium]
MEKQAGRENMTLGGFLAELFLSKRSHSLDREDSKQCWWSRSLEHFFWRWLFAFAGSLTYCVGVLLWVNYRVGNFDPLLVIELLGWKGQTIAAASIFFALILGLQDRGGGPLRLFIQGIALPALVVGVAGISTIFVFSSPGSSG